MTNLFPVTTEELERLAILNEECAKVQQLEDAKWNKQLYEFLNDLI